MEAGGVEDRQVLATIDEVLARAVERRESIELRTARVATRDGYRYVSGVGDAFLHHLRALLVRTVAPGY